MKWTEWSARQMLWQDRQSLARKRALMRKRARWVFWLWMLAGLAVLIALAMFTSWLYR